MESLAGWSGNRERRDERTKRKREKEKEKIMELQNGVELNSIKSKPNINSTEEKTDSNLTAPDLEEDVIIGRFRKISSAKSMAATNGNVHYPVESAPRLDNDLESGIHGKSKEATEHDKLLSVSQKPVLTESKLPLTKSSFRDVEKPSRFKDQPSITRFQMNSGATPEWVAPGVGRPHRPPLATPLHSRTFCSATPFVR
ncbi:hypothetical protein EVAR_27930_1 [Eumeta japonica]|uniref:Uncharacterized protein n=1 Tax=Eumeta variegata TaxID=151549 RepID=A0A4C1UWC4_EUMVA|nr:hypothetical protein EVAR_27930_1 [Eumeta japonica]